MKLTSHIDPARARVQGEQPSRSGRALGLLLVLVLVAGLIWVLLASSAREGPSADRAETPSRGAMPEARPPAEATADPAELSLQTPVMPDTSEAANPQADAGPGATGEVSPQAAPGARAGRGLLDPKRMRASMERLHRTEDDATRLAAAREILAGETPGALALRALDVLAELEPTAVAGELRRLADGAAEDPRTSALVMGAIQSLGRREDALSAGDLGALFEGGSMQVRIAAAAALAARGDESLSLRFREQRADDLVHEDAGVRVAAVRDLAALPGQTSLALVLPLLVDESGEVRLAALNAVQRSRDPFALERIRPLVDDPSAAVRGAAARMVETMERRQELARDPGRRLEAPGTRPGKLAWKGQR